VGPRSAAVVTPATPAPATYSDVDYALGSVNGKETGRRLFSSLLEG
jgi:hypothetical protein